MPLSDKSHPFVCYFWMMSACPMLQFVSGRALSFVVYDRSIWEMRTRRICSKSIQLTSIAKNDDAVIYNVYSTFAYTTNSTHVILTKQREKKRKKVRLPNGKFGSFKCSRDVHLCSFRHHIVAFLSRSICNIQTRCSSS